MGWETKLEQLWNNGYEHLLSFKEAFHHTEVRVKYRSPDGFSLGPWCNRQREYFREGKLSAEQIGKMERIGFSFNQQKKKASADVGAGEHGTLSDDQPDGPRQIGAALDNRTVRI